MKPLGSSSTPQPNSRGAGDAVASYKLLARRLSLCIPLLSILLQGCYYPAPSVDAPLASATITPPALLVSLKGSATLTPFQPAPPTATSTATPTAPAPPSTPTATPSPTSTPVPPSHTPTQVNWPPPNVDGLGPTPATEVPAPLPVLSGPETVNFLLLGSDRRAASFRTDTLVIASLRPGDRLVTLISIPRDLYVYLPGWTMARINTAYLRGELSDYPGGGSAFIRDTVLYNLGIRIDHVAMVEFDGFRKIVDTLGGIDVPVACSFTDWHIKDPEKSEHDPNNWELYTLEPGLVHMDGDLALWYARSRLRSSDFDRGRRQQEVLRAIYARGLKLDVIPRIPALYKDLREAVTTDVDLGDLLDLVPLAKDLSAARIRSYYIDRTYVTGWRTPGGAAVQLPDIPVLQAMLHEAMSPEDPDSIPVNPVVEIQNGTPQRDWEYLAAERLHYAGFDTQITPAEHRQFTDTYLYSYSVEEDPARDLVLRRALGLPASSLVPSPNPESAIAYRLVLGENYKPCFNPANLSR